MNHRQPPHAPGRARRSWSRLPILLLPALLPGISLAGPHGHSPPNFCPLEPTPEPYLRHVGAPPLRFQPAIQIAAAFASPAIASTSGLALQVPETGIASDSPPAVKSAEPASIESKPEAPVANPKARMSAPILPDDARPTVRPEDFLPYFQYPGAGAKSGEVMINTPVPLNPPAPGTLPASSATFIQR